MYVDINRLKELHAEGTVMAHNFGPPPEVVIRLFETNPVLWRADLQVGNQLYEKNLASRRADPEDHIDAKGGAVYSIPIVEARERDGVDLYPEDLLHAITILGEHFQGCGAFKIQGGAEFGGYRRNIPSLIFIWWD